MVAVMAPGPAISGIASGKAAMSCRCSSTACSASLAARSLAEPEHHLEGDREQQQPAGDAERRQCDAELPQQPVADQRRADQDRARDQAGAQRHLAAELRRQAVGDGQESRHQADRIDHDQQRHQRGNQEFERHRDRPKRVRGPFVAL